MGLQSYFCWELRDGRFSWFQPQAGRYGHASGKLHWARHGNEYETAVLFGDPEQPGSFYVMRYRVLIACDVPPHWHPEDEHATVISGEISLGLGEKFSAEALRTLTAGSYALIPSQQPHFTHYEAGSIVQVHGIGPLVVNYLE